MADEGIGGVKILKLCRILGVTKGSFYWHFADLGAFLESLADRWREGRWIAYPGFNLLGQPEELMFDAMKLFVDPHISGIDRSMREWARTDSRARAAIEESDTRLFDLLVTCFRGIGFEPVEADLRAKILFYSGVGFSAAGPIGDLHNVSRQLESMVALLTRRGDPVLDHHSSPG